ncbi:hypothetical protein ABZY19_06400 [Streptomyces sp. NPDC006475]|uniref:hypothetical protein n=1 Tax=Streptomyces sp. NPDC006475 TaxID=3155719 RepID=UPI0033AE0F30
MYVANEGSVFTDRNFRAITELALSDKGVGEGIGNKGLGFRSVLQLTDWPEIYSKASPSSVDFDGYCFRFARPDDVRAIVADTKLADRAIKDISPLALPVPAVVTDPVLKDLAAEGFSTVIRLPLRNQHALDASIKQATEAVSGEAPLLLFLDRISELVVDIQDSGDRTCRRALSRAVRPSALVTREEADWVDEVDLAEGGRYLVARRVLALDDLRDVIEQSVETREIDAKWQKWEGEAWVGVALRLDKDLERGRMYTFLPMSGATARTPFCGHAHAPFFTKLARLHLSETVGLNSFLLNELAGLCARLAKRLRSEGPHSIVRNLILDLVCWDVPTRIDEALDGKLADEPIVPLAGADSWGTLRESFAWPDGARPWTVLTAEALAKAGAPMLDPSVGPLRQARILKLHQDLLKTIMRALPRMTAGWVEGVAERLKPTGEEQPSSQWAGFYDDVAQAFANDPEVLRGRRIILDQEGRLRSALGGQAASGKSQQTVFFHPEHETGDSVARVPKDLKALRRRMAFTHPGISWGRPGRAFLEDQRLVRPYRPDRVFDALSDLLAASPSDPLCRDALAFAFRQFPALTEADRRRLPRIGFRLPLADGSWARATRCLFSPPWGTEGARGLARFLDAGGAEIPPLAALRKRWITDPEAWPAPVDDRDAYADFLRTVGVGDGLPLMSVGRNLGAAHGRNMQPGTVARALRLGDDLGHAWEEDVREEWSDFAHPWTPYEFRRPLAHLPGAVDVAELGPAARREFAELLIRGLRTWGDEAFTVSIHRPGHKIRDTHTWPSPLASFLRSMPWLPSEGGESDGPVFVTPDRTWFSTEGELPPFVPSLPLSIRKLLTDKAVLARLRKCGLRFWDEPEHAGAAVKDLGAIVASGDVPDHFNVSFKKHYGKAWSHLVETERWPWSAGESIQLAVVREHILTTLTPSSGKEPVYICDEFVPFKEALVELAGYPVLIAGPDDGAEIARKLESNGTQVVRLSATKVQVHDRDEKPITPTADHVRLTEGRDWLVLVVALVLELKSGAFLRRSERTVRALLDQLRSIRIVQADDIEILISGERVEPPPTTRSLPLPDADNPTVVVWNSEGDWDELQACTPAVAQLLQQPSLQDALELVLVKLERQLAGEMPDHIDDHTLAQALDTTESKIAELRRSLTGDLHHTIRLLLPVMVCLAGTDQTEAVSAALGDATSEEELAAILERHPCSLPLPAAALLPLTRTCTTAAELRDALGLDFQAFNQALDALGPPYAPVTHSDLHERAFGDFVRTHADAIVDRLRERYAPQAAKEEDVAGYAVGRHLGDLAPDPDWLVRFVSPPEEEMRLRVAAWLRSHGADDDLERPSDLQPVDELRTLNTTALDRLVLVLAKLVSAWCRRHGTPVPYRWNSAPSMEARTALESSGLVELLVLGDQRLIGEVARSVGWPVGMPLSADRDSLGLTALDLTQPPPQRSGTAGSRGSLQSTITVGENEIAVGRDQFAAIADLAARTVDETFLSQSGKVRLGPMTAVPQARHDRDTRTSRIVVARINQVNEDQKAAIGLVGEVAARAWLERRHAEVRWASGYAAIINEDADASDGHGYDFEVTWRNTTRLYEVKATSEAETAQMEFELGVSEERTARAYARGTRYQILLITSVLDPEQRRVFELPNPFAAAGRDRFRMVGRGLRYQFSPVPEASRRTQR